MRFLVSITLLVLTNAIFAQLPSVDIYHGKLVHADGKWSLTEITNFTKRRGYDNQPSFSADGSTIYYVAIQDSIQSDVYAYTVATKSINQLTATQESEYSPVMLGNGKGFTVVRVEQDSTQRMWVFKADGSKPKVFIENVDSIGYYGSIDDKRYACFMVTDTPTLVITDTKKQNQKVIDSNIGRCIKIIPGEQAISYIVKSSGKEWMVKRFDLNTQTSSLIAVIPPVSEDFVWTNKGELLMPRDNQIWMYDYKGGATNWSRIITVKELKGKTIYRLALAADGVNFAFVADE